MGPRHSRHDSRRSINHAAFSCQQRARIHFSIASWAAYTVRADAAGSLLVAVKVPSGVSIAVSADRDHSVVVFAPYGLTVTTASSAVDGRCLDVTVTHSPGFTVLIADTAVSGTFRRIVMY